MAIPQSAGILHHLRQSALRHDKAGLTDGQLLRSFLYRSDEAAFEALMRRHGPMVRGVCRRVLRNLADADDAFQAAFLVLIRKASSLTTREILGDWLHGVAYRTALKARSTAARRRMKETQAVRHEALFDEDNRSEWLPLLDEEIGRLPTKYRLPVVLCDLEGHTRKEAAQHLGWPEGTVSGRLSRARTILARRLTRRGVTLSAASLAASMAGEVSARLPFSVVHPICKSALEYAARSAGTVPAHVAALTEGVVKAMFLTKLKNALVLVTVAVVLIAGAGAYRYAAWAAEHREPSPEKTAHAAAKVDADSAPIILPHPMPAAGPAVGAPTTPNAAPAPIPPATAANRAFLIELHVTEMQDGRSKELANPRLATVEGRPASFALGGYRTIPLGGGKSEQVWVGTTIRTVIRSGKADRVHLDMTVSLPTRTTISDAVMLDTKTIRRVVETTLDSRLQFAVDGADATPMIVTVVAQEYKPKLADFFEAYFADFSNWLESEKQAEKAYQMAEFWRRTGHPGSAYFYYEIVTDRYRLTAAAKRSKERMIELEKLLEKKSNVSEANGLIKERLIESKRQMENPQTRPTKAGKMGPARVGQIFIVGNKKISEEAILEQVKLYPGQLLSFPDLRDAEKNLSRLKEIVGTPEVMVIDHEGAGEFKDIRITVEEK